MIGFEDFLGLVQIEPILGLDRPWKLDQPFEISANDADFR